MMLMGVFDMIINMLIFVIWLFYCMLFVVVIILRKCELNMEWLYKVLLYLIIFLIVILVGLFVLINILFI